MAHTTVKELVDKYNTMKEKQSDLFLTIAKMKSKELHATEVLEHARKDQRYSVQLLLQEYDRVTADIVDFENCPVRYLND